MTFKEQSEELINEYNSQTLYDYYGTSKIKVLIQAGKYFIKKINEVGFCNFQERESIIQEITDAIKKLKETIKWNKNTILKNVKFVKRKV